MMKNVKNLQPQLTNCNSDLVKEINKMNSKLEHVETSIGTINSRLENAIQKVMKL